MEDTQNHENRSILEVYSLKLTGRHWTYPGNIVLIVVAFIIFLLTRVRELYASVRMVGGYNLLLLVNVCDSKLIRK